MRARDGVDLVRAATLVAWTGGRLALRRRRAGGVPRSIDDVTPQWLTSLVASTAPGAQIERADPIGVDAGTTTRVRLRVALRGVANPPETLFLKLAPPALATAVFVEVMRLGEQEVRFYRTFATQLGARVPRAWGTAWHAPTGRFALLLGDLAAEGCELPSVASRPASVADAEAMMAALAAVHAPWWDRPPPRWLRMPARHRRLYLERALTRLAVTRAAASHVLGLPADLRLAMPRLLAARDRFEAAWAIEPLTVIHGDAHAGNTFRRPDGTTGLLDWQVVQHGQGMRDVSYFLCNSVPTETRRRHERDLIRLYLSELAARGVSPPSVETAWTQHRLHSVYAWIAAAFTAGAERLQPGEVVRAGVERASAAIADLDALAAARPPGSR